MEPDQDDRLHLAGAAAGLPHRVGGVEPHPLPLQRPADGLVAARLGRDLDHTGHLDAALQRQRRRPQADGAGAQDHHPSRGERAIPRHQGMGAVGPRGACLLPPGEGHPEVSGAGRHDQALVADEPGPLFAGQTQDRPLELPNRWPVPEGAPHRGAQLHVDTGLVGLGERRIGLHHPLHHQRPVPHGWAHALSEVERHVHGHHVGIDGVLVEEQHVDSGPGCLRRGGDARRAGADHDQRHAPLHTGRLPGDGLRIYPSLHSRLHRVVTPCGIRAVGSMIDAGGTLTQESRHRVCCGGAS